ncbi:MAG TPA: toll/interleukin-1 receptor domain-containing protein, partial [Anaerolineales bacterium]|nr:toll/interleukin-1 receptor domain-containing protein [Anaerolineales bacterium]
WDRNIPTGRAFDQVIEEALDQSRCVVVLWSTSSVKSNWVKDEASEGVRRNVLVPVCIDNVNIPLGFRRIQTANMTGWQGSPTDAVFERLVTDISSLLGTPSARPEKRSLPPEPIRSRGDSVTRNVLVGVWSGTYIQDDGYYPFTLIIESESADRFKGRIVEPLPDWISTLDHPVEIKSPYLRSSVTGRMNKNEGLVEFTKKYEESELGLAYEVAYSGTQNGPYITGQYSVDDVNGPFELVRESS